LSPDLRPFQNPGINAGAPTESAALGDLPGRRVGPQRVAPPPNASADSAAQLLALAEARSRFVPAVLHRPRRFSGVALAILAALIVGTALLLAGPSQNHCAATFRITAPTAQNAIGFHRKELLEYAWADLAARPDSRAALGGWFVDEPEPGVLRICLKTTDSRAGVERATAIARGFLSHLNDLTNEARATPTEGENILSTYLKQFQERLANAQEQLEAAILALPATDPRIDREALLTRWHDIRTDFASAREKLTQAAEKFSELRNESEPTHGVVSPDERRTALLADDALQQDFKELNVTLTELKLHMLNVWQRSSPALDGIEAACTAFAEKLSRCLADGSAADARSAAEQLSSAAASYRDARAAFSQAWTSEFTALQQHEVDPQSGDVLDVYQRLRTLLDDFLFAGGQRLSAMRSQVNAIAKNPADNARHHVLQSELTRGFQQLQAEHHRFEFAAGSIETPENFRLDSALRIARGLRRRTTEQMQNIEERLQAKAAQRARRQQAEAMASIDEVLQRSRAASDQTVGELVALQDGLNETATLSEAFVAAVLRAELANSRFQMTRKDLDQTEEHLNNLASRRASAAKSADITLVSCGVVGAAANLSERLRISGTGASVTFLVVLVGQLLLRRRREDHGNRSAHISLPVRQRQSG